MLQARARAFDFQPTRSGTLIKFTTRVQCSTCPEHRFFESIRKLPDEAILKKFKDWGWLMGRSRSYDICPGCLGTKPENKLADRFKVTEGGKPVPNSAEVVEIAGKHRTAERTRIAAVIDKHLPKRPLLTIGGPKEEREPTAAQPSKIQEPARDANEMSADALMVRVLAELTAIRENQQTLRENQRVILSEVENIKAAQDLVLEDNSSIHGEHAEIVSKLDSLAGIASIRTEGIAKAMETLAVTVGVAKPRQDSAAAPVKATKDIRHPVHKPMKVGAKALGAMFDQPPTPIQLTPLAPLVASLMAVEKPARRPRATTQKAKAVERKIAQACAQREEVAGRPRKRRQSLVG